MKIETKDPYTVGIRELKQRMGYYMTLVRRGQSVTITDRGHEVATVVPKTPKQAIDPDVAALIRAGYVHWSGRKPTLPTPVKIRGGPLSDTVLEDRR